MKYRNDRIAAYRQSIPLSAAHRQVQKYTPGIRPSLMKAQCKLNVGAENDQFEQEADAMASRVVNMPGHEINRPGSMQHTTNTGETAMRKTGGITPYIQQSTAQNETMPTSDRTGDRINAERGGGNMMDDHTRSFMESRFGADFSRVKLHTDSNAVQLSREMNARAFTVGNDIYFNQGEYNPNSREGQYLLAHELTHTLQQGAANNATPVVQRFPIAIIAIGAAAIGAFLFVLHYYDRALNEFPSKSDKWKHCWVSCEVAAGGSLGLLSIIAGIGKEAVDKLCDFFGGPCGAEWADIVADLQGNACAVTPYSGTCQDCCNANYP